MQLYLIRHGESYVNLSDWTDGNKDTGLTPLGQRQAAALADWIVGSIPHVDAIFASTMSRARETAETVAGAYAKNIYFDDRLREVGNNRHDHSAWPNDALPRSYADHWASEYPFSSVTPSVEMGESWMHFRTRVGSFIEEIVQERTHQTVLAVCHGGVVEAVFDHIFNCGPWRRCEVWDRNTAVTHFEYVAHPNRETWRLHYHNRQEHLGDVA